MKRYLTTLVVSMALALALALACVAGSACRGVLAGDPCDTTADCDPPLLCSNENAPEGTGGICVQPEAVPDAAVALDASPTADASP